MKKLTPLEVAKELFKIHTHAEIVNKQDSNQIVYREKDIIKLLNKLGHPKPDWKTYGGVMMDKCLKKGVTTNRGVIVDITTSWKPKAEGRKLYYVTKTPELYKKGKACGVWKLAEELQII